MIQTAAVQKKREAWIDYVRILAILLVVLCHSVEAYYWSVMQGEEQIRFLPWLVENTLFIIGRLGVPLFLAISGTLLLGREYDIFSFYKKSVLPLVVTTEIWTIFNFLFACIVYKKPFTLALLLRQILFLDAPSLSHMWYMPMIIGIYIFIPFVSKLLQEYSRIRYYLIPMLLVGISSVLIPTITVFLNEDVLGELRIGLRIDTDFGGGVYGLYLIMGYFIGRKKILKKVKTLYLLAIMTICLIGNTAGQFYIYSHHYYKWDDLLWYTSLPIFLIGLSLFELFRRSERILENNNFAVVSALARGSFGIYLLHNPIKILCFRYLPMDHVNEMIKIIILFIMSAGLSIVILVPFLVKWKKAGKILFFIK